MVTTDLPVLEARPNRSTPVDAYLARLHSRYAGLRDGVVASYIPELADVDPDAFGIAIATVDGSLYEVGDTRTPFTIQSMSKPLTYALVLESAGEAEVHRRIGVEPTGDRFNSISLHPDTGAPFNAMINAGAIAAAGMIGGSDRSGGSGGSMAIDRLLDGYARFAGRALGVDERVYRSERETGHRNRAIAHLLRGSAILDEDPDDVVDRYFRQCAVVVDTRDLALIAATLASGGRNPMTGLRAVSPRTVRIVLSVMASCGMYDGAGEWFVGVGLPAKSGVSGGILAVLPGQLGIAVWSPPLDAHGNSVRGVAVCRDLSSAMDLHLFTAALSPATPIRSHRTLATRWSKRVRRPEERLMLASQGERSHLVELQGDIGFSAVETVLRAIGTPMAAERVVLDLARVTRLDPATAPLLADLAVGLDARGGCGLAWSDGRAHASTLDAVDGLLEAMGVPAPPRFAELDAAVEWSEERTLEMQEAVGGEAIPLVRHPVLAGLSPEAFGVLGSLLVPRSWQAGDAVVRQGEPARELYLITAGELSVYVPLEGRERGRRLATLTAGMVLGEVSFLAGGLRTADVVADSPVDAWILDIDTFRRIRATKPEVAAALLENLYAIVAAIAKRLTDEVASIAA
jgi:glutaminase